MNANLKPNNSGLDGLSVRKTMQRLKLSFEKEQRFFNDAAHELKTAVAVVRSTIQLVTMRQRSTEEYCDGLNRALADNAASDTARLTFLAQPPEHLGDLFFTRAGEPFGGGGSPAAVHAHI